MYSKRCLKLLFPLSWLIIAFCYVSYSIVNTDVEKSLMKHAFQENFSEYYFPINQTTEHNDLNDFLIDTPGCTIPNYMKTMQIVEAKYDKGSTCGYRAVFIKKISEDEIVFTIDDVVLKLYTMGGKYSCCYKFASPSVNSEQEDYTKLRYSTCTEFEDKTTVKLKQEIITVACVLRSSKNRVIYEDAYIILKKLNRNTAGVDQKSKKPWNVLILGMDTMSRARAYNSMPKTVQYMLQNNWLDYRGYQKVGYNTFPNVLSLLTGKKMSTIYKACSSGMDNCNKLLIWSEFQKAGYVTATGEEYLKLPDTFSKFGFKFRPTDHYIRPFFLTGESNRGNIICAKKKPSAIHIIDYAASFAEGYRDDNFFGMFWLNSYSHNLINVPTLIDRDIVNFFTQLSEAGVLENTFVYFLSDHGIRYGQMRLSYESYYEERLPMFFLWVPTMFRSMHVKEYNNLLLNQKRLVTPYNLYLTLIEVATESQLSIEINSEACPNCTSIFNEISAYKTCEEAGVEEKWCTCHELYGISDYNDDVVTARALAVMNLQNKIKKIKSVQCARCEILELKETVRSHAYEDRSTNSTYFVLAIVMSPGDVAYEATVVKHNETFNIILPTYTISVYNTRGNCVIDKNDRPYCVCKEIKGCKSKGLL